MENAPLMFGYVLPAFLLTSTIVFIAAYRLGRSKKNRVCAVIFASEKRDGSVLSIAFGI